MQITNHHDYAWFNVPHIADDDFITQFAIYVRDNLNPNMLALFEYSNECFNWQFAQANWLLDQATAAWGASDGNRHLSWQGKRSTEMCLLIDAVYGSRTNYRKVLGGWAAGPSSATNALEAPTWLADDPDNYVAPHTLLTR